MRSYRFVSLFALTLASGPSPAWAFIDPPYITPVQPGAGDAISVNVYRGDCDVLDIGIVPPAIEEHNGHITALFTGIHEDDPEWCIYSTGTETVLIGTFPPGSYTLEVDRRYMSTFGTWIQETLGIIPFTVLAAPSQQPIAAPTLSSAGLGVLGLTLLVAVFRDLRKRLA